MVCNGRCHARSADLMLQKHLADLKLQSAEVCLPDSLYQSKRCARSFGLTIKAPAVPRHDPRHNELTTCRIQQDCLGHARLPEIRWVVRRRGREVCGGGLEGCFGGLFCRVSEDEVKESTWRLVMRRSAVQTMAMERLRVCRLYWRDEGGSAFLRC